MVFFGTPHRGSGKAGLAQLVATAARFAYGQPNSKLIDNLKRDSDVLEQQRKSFASITNSMPLVCFVEQNPTKIGMVSRTFPWRYLAWSLHSPVLGEYETMPVVLIGIDRAF